MVISSASYIEVTFSFTLLRVLGVIHAGGASFDTLALVGQVGRRAPRAVRVVEAGLAMCHCTH